MDIEENVPLAPLTTFALGGPARFLARVRSGDELKQSLDFARSKNLRVHILGGGSNVLVADEGFDGMIVKIEFRGIKKTSEGYLAAAGEPWDALCARAAADGLWGIENLSGIPGTVGGACVQNIGAYGAALSQVLEWVEALEVQTGEVVRLSKVQCRFGYRDSIFKQEAGRYVVLRAAVTLSSEPKPNLSYKDLADYFSDPAARFHLAELRQAVLDIRKRKFPDLAREGTAGSFFLNPMVPKAQAEMLKAHHPNMPLFTMPETHDIKVPLGWLLDHALNLKGYAVGGARLFERQALVIAASRAATAADVLALRDLIKEKVRTEIGIEIQEEVKVLS